MNPNQQALNDALSEIFFKEKIDVPRMKELISFGADPNALHSKYGYFPLIMVSGNNYLDFVRYFIEECGANINNQDHYGMTALMTAGDHGHRNTIKYLVKNNANPNIQDKQGKTALMWTIQRGQFEIIKILADISNLDIKDKHNHTVFDYAEDNEKTLKILQDIYEEKKITMPVTKLQDIDRTIFSF